jgi:hypothetical protein
MRRPPLPLSVVLLFTSPLFSQVSFFSPPSYEGTGNLFVADFTSSGNADLLSSDGTLELGNGNGTFTLGTPVGGTLPVLAVADFNGDGKPDVLEQGTGTLLVLLGNGNGTFQSPISSPSGAALIPVVAGSLRGNSEADVVGVFNNSLILPEQRQRNVRQWRFLHFTAAGGSHRGIDPAGRCERRWKVRRRRDHRR